MRSKGWKRARADLWSQTEVMPDQVRPVLVVDSLAVRCHLRCAELRISLEDLAVRLGIHPGSLARALYRRRVPEGWLRQLSKALEMSLEDWASPEPLSRFQGQERRIWRQMRAAIARQRQRI